MSTPDAAGKGERSALILLGCPQVPIQTAVAVYLARLLKKNGITPVIAGNRAARGNVEVADPDRHYTGELIDIDRYISLLSENERDFSLNFIFIHNDSGVVYAATVQSLSRGPVIGVIFGEHADDVAASISFPCEKVSVKAVHNPMPLRKKIDEVFPWVVSNL